MSEIDILSQLKKQLVTFLDELIESFPEESEFIIFRIFVNDKIPIVDIMKYITENLCPLKDMVKSRNEDFFLNHNILFERLESEDSSKVNYFKNMWTSGTLDDDNKEIIWKWFESFINIGNKYIDYVKKR